MGTGQYILEGTRPVEVFDLTKWGEYMQKRNRHVADDRLPNGVRVSTVFLGLDHSWWNIFKALRPGR